MVVHLPGDEGGTGPGTPAPIEATQQACPGCGAAFRARGGQTYGCAQCGVSSLGAVCACGALARYAWSLSKKAPEGWVRLTPGKSPTPTYACCTACALVAVDALAVAGLLAVESA